MLLGLLSIGLIGTTTVESICCGVGIGTGLYVASRTKKTTAMPKVTR